MTATLCPKCSGSGTMHVSFGGNPGSSITAGSYETTCHPCNGTGILSDAPIITVNITITPLPDETAEVLGERVGREVVAALREQGRFLNGGY